MAGRTHDLARIALGTVRLFTGTAGLVAPDRLARRLGVDPDQHPGVLYFIRLFGIRTVLIGAELLVRQGERRDEALKLAILIHASDTMAATLTALSKRAPSGAWTIVAISAVNTALALYASRGASAERAQQAR